MKKKIRIAIVLLLIFGSVYLGTKVIFLGDQREKANLLSEAMWTLSEQGYTKEDIDNIDIIYNPIKTLNHHQYLIEVKPKGKEAFYLVWTSDKTRVVRLENS